MSPLSHHHFPPLHPPLLPSPTSPSLGLVPGSFIHVPCRPFPAFTPSVARLHLLSVLLALCRDEGQGSSHTCTCLACSRQMEGGARARLKAPVSGVPAFRCQPGEKPTLPYWPRGTAGEHTRGEDAPFCLGPLDDSGEPMKGPTDRSQNRGANHGIKIATA